jgi:hypothetical protein
MKHQQQANFLHGTSIQKQVPNQDWKGVLFDVH